MMMAAAMKRLPFLGLHQNLKSNLKVAERLESAFVDGCERPLWILVRKSARREYHCLRNPDRNPNRTCCRGLDEKKKSYLKVSKRLEPALVHGCEPPLWILVRKRARRECRLRNPDPNPNGTCCRKRERVVLVWCVDIEKDESIVVKEVNEAMLPSLPSASNGLQIRKSSRKGEK